jgi:hypothetical protein
MLRFIARALLFAALVVVLNACASGRAPAPTSGSAADTLSSGNESAAQARNHRAFRHSLRARREMTVREYYYDVEQRTARAGGFVMWFNPPRGVRRSGSAPTEPQQQLVDGTLPVTGAH